MLKRYKLKLLPDTNKVSRRHIKQFFKENDKSKESLIKILIIRKYTSDERIYPIVITKIRIK